MPLWKPRRQKASVFMKLAWGSIMLTWMQKVKKRYIDCITSEPQNKNPPLAQILTKSNVERKCLDYLFYNSDSNFIFTFIILMPVSIDNIPKTNNMTVINYIFIIYKYYIHTHTHTHNPCYKHIEYHYAVLNKTNRSGEKNGIMYFWTEKNLSLVSVT